MTSSFIQRVLGCAVLWAVFSGHGFAQSGSRRETAVSGTVVDPSDAVIQGASVILSAGNRELLRTSTDEKGEFHFDAVARGDYELSAGYDGFKTSRTRLRVGTRAAGPLRMALEIADIQATTEVTLPVEQVSVEPGDNLDVMRFDPRQFENLPLMNRDIFEALTPLLDPSAVGAGGPDVIVDGLPSGELGIPLAEIEEVIINKNPYSAEFARPGKGRIEIITKSGSSKYHGSLFFNFRDYRLDGRNAFDDQRQPQRRRQFEAHLSGPITKGKKNTFSITASHSQDDLDPSVHAVDVTGPVRGNTPYNFTTNYFSSQFTRRVQKNALSFRYTHYDYFRTGVGTGGFVLPETGTDVRYGYHQLFSSYRVVLSPRLLNEMFVRVRSEDTAMRDRLQGVPKLIVLQTITRGGAQSNLTTTNSGLEFSDNLSWSLGPHLLKMGVNIPSLGRFGSNDRSNSEGTFTFSTLADYSQGRPFSFLKQAGDGRIVFWPKQVAGFVQDEMRLQQNLSITLGVRYKWQNYVDSYNNFAPRMSFAYAPGKGRKTVFRGGAGFFYDNMGAGLTASMLRLSSGAFRQILLTNPNYPNPLVGVPSITDLPPDLLQFSPTLASPYNFQYSFGIERQLRKSLTFVAAYYATHGLKLYRSRDVNAPLPPFYIARPDPSFGLVQQIESSAGMQSRQLEATLRGTMTRFFTGMVVYRLGNARNDTDGIGSYPANNWDPRGEWGRASFDMRHFLYLYGTLRAGKWIKFGVIYSATSGLPYTMTTGLDDYHDGMANARPQGVPRHTLEGTGSSSLNVRWSHEFPLHIGVKEGLHLVTSVDAFNLLNHVNYASFVGDLSSPLFGTPDSAGSARRFQLGATLKF